MYTPRFRGRRPDTAGVMPPWRSVHSVAPTAAGCFPPDCALCGSRGTLHVGPERHALEQVHVKAELTHYSRSRQLLFCQCLECMKHRRSNLFGEVAVAPSIFLVGSVCVCGFGLRSRGCAAAVQSTPAMELPARLAAASCFLDYAQP